MAYLLTDEDQYSTGSHQGCDQSLLQRLAEGDRDAFWPLWMQYQDELFSRYCLRWMGGNRHEAEDAMSSASLKACQCLPIYAHRITNVRGWFISLLRNHCIDIQRTHKHRTQYYRDMDHSTHAQTTAAIDVYESPEAVALRKELRQNLQHAIQTLPPRLYELSRLRLIDNLPYHDIANELDLTPANARKLLQMARSRLRDLLCTYRQGAPHASVLPSNRIDDTLPAPPVKRMRQPSARDALSRHQTIVPQSQAVRALCIRLSGGMIQPIYLALDHKPTRQQQKMAALRRYVQQHPSGWKKRLALAHLLYSMGQWVEAEQLYAQLLDKHPQCMVSGLRLAEMNQLSGNIDKAISTYEHLLQGTHSLATQQHITGLIATCKYQVNEALTAFTRAAESEPQNSAHWHAIGLTSLAKRCPSEALTVFEHTLQYHPNDLVALAHSAMILLQDGHSDQAIQRLNHVLELDPNHVFALQQLVNLRIDKGLLEGQADTDTCALLRRMRHLAPDAPDVQAAQARYHLVRAENAKGLDVLHAFTSHHPTSAAGWWYLAQWYRHTGQMEPAVDAIQRAYGLLQTQVALTPTIRQHVDLLQDTGERQCHLTALLREQPTCWTGALPTGHILIPIASHGNLFP